MHKILLKFKHQRWDRHRETITEINTWFWTTAICRIANLSKSNDQKEIKSPAEYLTALRSDQTSESKQPFALVICVYTGFFD